MDVTAKNHTKVFFIFIKKKINSNKSWHLLLFDWILTEADRVSMHG